MDSVYKPDWLHAYGQPRVHARIKSKPDDFIVIEHLPFELTGSGQHVFLKIRKRQRNTADVAKALARFAQLAHSSVGYAGLKDKEADTQQWFSVDLAGKAEPDWSQLSSDSLSICEKARHNKKLRVGAVKNNEFQLLLRDIDGDRNDLNKRLDMVKESGVPNYFGEQRFGRGFENITQGLKLIRGELKLRNRQLRGIYYSALRSFLFNEVLSARVKEHSWNLALPGEILILDGSRSFFIAQSIDAEIERRLAEFDIHPSGPLPGKVSGRDVSPGQLEQHILVDYADWCESLAAAGIQAMRRPLRVRPLDMQWSWIDENDLQLRFLLPAGCYATSVVRELAVVQ